MYTSLGLSPTKSVRFSYKYQCIRVSCVVDNILEQFIEWELSGLVQALMIKCAD